MEQPLKSQKRERSAGSNSSFSRHNSFNIFEAWKPTSFPKQDILDLLSSSCLNWISSKNPGHPLVDQLSTNWVSNIIVDILKGGSNLTKIDSVALYLSKTHEFDENNKFHEFARGYFVENIVKCSQEERKSIDLEKIKSYEKTPSLVKSSERDKDIYQIFLPGYSDTLSHEITSEVVKNMRKVKNKVPMLFMDEHPSSKFDDFLDLLFLMTSCTPKKQGSPILNRLSKQIIVDYGIDEENMVDIIGLKFQPMFFDRQSIKYKHLAGIEAETENFYPFLIYNIIYEGMDSNEKQELIGDLVLSKYLNNRTHRKYTSYKQVKEIFTRLNFDDQYIHCFLQILSAVLLISVHGDSDRSLVFKNLKLSGKFYLEIIKYYNNMSVEGNSEIKSANSVRFFAQDLYNALLLKLITDVNNNFSKMFDTYMNGKHTNIKVKRSLYIWQPAAFQDLSDFGMINSLSQFILNFYHFYVLSRVQRMVKRQKEENATREDVQLQDLEGTPYFNMANRIKKYALILKTLSENESAFDNLKDLIDQLNEKDDKKFSQFIKRNNRIPTQLIIDNVNYSFADLKLQNRNSDFFSATEDFLKTKINSKDKAELNFMHDLAENPKKSFKKSNGSNNLIPFDTTWIKDKRNIIEVALNPIFYCTQRGSGTGLFSGQDIAVINLVPKTYSSKSMIEKNTIETLELPEIWKEGVLNCSLIFDLDLFRSIYCSLIKTLSIDTTKGTRNTLTELIKVIGRKLPEVKLHNNVRFGKTKILISPEANCALDIANYASKKNDSMLITSFLAKKKKNIRHSSLESKFEPLAITRNKNLYDSKADNRHSNDDTKELPAKDYVKLATQCLEYKISIIQDYKWDQESKNIYINALKQVINDLEKLKKQPNDVKGDLISDIFSNHVKKKGIKGGFKVSFYINDFKEIAFTEKPSKKSNKKANKIVSSHKLTVTPQNTAHKPCYVCGSTVPPVERIWECCVCFSTFCDDCSNLNFKCTGTPIINILDGNYERMCEISSVVINYPNDVQVRVPTILYNLLEIMEMRGLKTPEIYRLNGDENQIKNFFNKYNLAYNRPNVFSMPDYHDIEIGIPEIAVAVKRVYGCSNNGFISEEMFSHLKSIFNSQELTTIQKQCQFTDKLKNGMSKIQYDMIVILCAHLRKAMAFPVNKLNPASLSVTIGPNFRDKKAHLSLNSNLTNIENLKAFTAILKFIFEMPVPFPVASKND